MRASGFLMGWRPQPKVEISCDACRRRDESGDICSGFCDSQFVLEWFCYDLRLRIAVFLKIHLSLACEKFKKMIYFVCKYVEISETEF